MVFASICKHVNSVFIFASTSSCHFFFLRAASTLENTDGEQRTLQKNTDGEQRALRVLRKFSASRNLSFIIRIHGFAPSNHN